MGEDQFSIKLMDCLKGQHLRDTRMGGEFAGVSFCREKLSVWAQQSKDPENTSH